mmetsp:Transcript_33332/g.33948  ORF Transcript_33332/g.33948 Transcript_33332/m.33948 type:complete len:263 (+) Transcript_33332:191-979(+)|eukprot:CAMPEP_0182431496 /NCGR_PEP_ID=MMETSP1167-20130531/49660_1 /TAXON_ID=2988 /ORGANISM="Mallomonas Sp, Strain CCMP3275" /LENGTH=262 /DNA_ID=CAMNT_0024617905 /DNA_START=122 /DNA_END=910 /DNA_ORIENTATION=-
MLAVRCDVSPRETEIRQLIKLLDRRPVHHIDKKKQAIENSKSTLMLAIEFDHHGFIGQLLELGVDVNAKDYFGNTALFVAIRHKALDVIPMLLEYDASVFTLNDTSNTVLMEASRLGFIQLVIEFIRLGINVNHRNKYSDTALIMAAHRNHKDIVQILLHHGAAVNIQNSDGTTALHYACQRNCFTISSALIFAGADPYMRDKKRKSSYDRCSTCELEEKLKTRLIRRIALELSISKHVTDNIFRLLRQKQHDAWRHVLLYV